MPKDLTDIAKTESWTRTLSAGDIVAFRFPHEREGDDLPKCRPSLVLDLRRIGGETFVELAYGTTRPKPKRAGYAIPVSAKDELETASLAHPTSFDGTRRIIVALTHSGFPISTRFDSPVLGRLSDGSLARMHAVRARIHAERDMARERRESRRRRRSPRVVTVERRAKGKRTVREQRHV